MLTPHNVLSGNPMPCHDVNKLSEVQLQSRFPTIYWWCSSDWVKVARNCPHIIVKISVTKLEHFKNVLFCGKEERKQKHKHKLVGQDGCPSVSTQVVYTFSFPMCDCLTYPIYRTKWRIWPTPHGPLRVPWAVAQQINARKKVDTSIECVSLDYTNDNTWSLSQGGFNSTWFRIWGMQTNSSISTAEHWVDLDDLF